ncbi:MAG: NAD(P)H-hydrate dehydratase [Phycisphaeraceae bacterium]|nr:NAD(P)H-hydrate dehydratase [Phycisphaeraceae bacterium]
MQRSKITDDEHDWPPLPARPIHAHKGVFGTVEIFGGCPHMPGAPALAARAALRIGAGRVRIATDEKTLALTLGIEPHATGRVIAGDPSAQFEPPPMDHILVVGPGWSTHSSRERLAQRLWMLPNPAVWDADGLNLLADKQSLHLDRLSQEAGGNQTIPRVLTPHPGEFRRLAGRLNLKNSGDDDASRRSGAAELAAMLGVVVVLKGSSTIISDGRVTLSHDAANPALSTAGSGDILSGIIAGLMAQGAPPLDAARWGVRLHSIAGRRWADQHGDAGLRAVELADLLPGILRELRRR